MRCTRKRAGTRAASDPETARQYLIGIVTRAVDRLTEIALERAEREELQALLAPHKAGFDPSREGSLLRRYEHSCHNAMFRYLDELKKRQAENPARGQSGYHGYYPRPSADWFNFSSAADDSRDRDDTDDCTDACDSNHHEDTTNLVEDSTDREGELAVTRAPALRNEPSLSEPAVANGVASLPNEPDRAKYRMLAHRSAGHSSLEVPDESEMAIPRALEAHSSPANFAKTRRDRGHGNAMTGSRRSGGGGRRSRGTPARGVVSCRLSPWGSFGILCCLCVGLIAAARYRRRVKPSSRSKARRRETRRWELRPWSVRHNWSISCESWPGISGGPGSRT